MEKDARIYVAGHRGLAGSALVRSLRSHDYTNLLLRTHAELELTDQRAVRQFFETQRPRYVMLAAAKVGGILANNSLPADFIQINLAIQTNVIHEAWRAGVKRLLFLGSSCIYPRDCAQPIKEEYLLTGPLEPTNRAYAVAKIAGVEQCGSYSRQHGVEFFAAMPNNMYGPGDNYDLQSSHVLPALIRKMHEAKETAASEVVIWGSGRPLREFLYSDDMAEACVFLMNLDEARYSQLLRATAWPLVNIGAGEEISIGELASLIAEVVGFRGRVVLDKTKPDGTPRKLLDSAKLLALGWRPKLDLREGIARAYADFRARFAAKV
jgi:GDP-L-fucose synthase